jgi:hypothetical protein
MKKALRQLITALNRISVKHGEVGDSAVRELMYEVVHKAFIAPQRGYDLPDEFGMFSEEGDQKVRAALSTFLAHPEVAEASTRLKSPKERLDSFQDMDVKSSHGNTHADYFGSSKATRTSTPKFQFTIGLAMSVIAVFAILLKTTASGLAAAVVFSLAVFYYALYRYVLPGPPLPPRRPAPRKKELT